MLFHVDMIYLAYYTGQMRCCKKLCFEMRTITKSNPLRDFFSLMLKRRKYAEVLPVFAQNKSILHLAYMYITAIVRPSDVKKTKPIMFYERMMLKFSGAVAPSPSP